MLGTRSPPSSLLPPPPSQPPSSILPGAGGFLQPCCSRRLRCKTVGPGPGSAESFCNPDARP